jgi:hypothetical protein
MEQREGYEDQRERHHDHERDLCGTYPSRRILDPSACVHGENDT